MCYEWRGWPCPPVPENQLSDSTRTCLLCGLSVYRGYCDSRSQTLLYWPRICYSKIARRICIAHSSLYLIPVTRLWLPEMGIWNQFLINVSRDIDFSSMRSHSKRVAQFFTNFMFMFPLLPMFLISACIMWCGYSSLYTISRFIFQVKNNSPRNETAHRSTPPPIRLYTLVTILRKRVSSYRIENSKQLLSACFKVLRLQWLNWK